MRRSGMTSRSKCASFSRNHTSCSSIGPRGPAVTTLLLSTTGAPAIVVSLPSGALWWPFPLCFMCISCRGQPKGGCSPNNHPCDVHCARGTPGSLPPGDPTGALSTLALPLSNDDVNEVGGG